MTFIHPQPYHIAIIGVGPKGLYTLEILLAQLKANNVESPVCIHLFNRSKYFGAGDIYDLEQPHYLVMNYHSRYIQMWRAGEPKEVTTDTPSFEEWLKKKYPQPNFPEDYAPRSVVGEYLHEGFQRIVEAVPANVEILTSQSEVVDCEKVGNRFFLSTRKEQLDTSFQQVVLTTGHPRPALTEERTTYKSFCDQHETTSHVEFVYPVQKNLAHIVSGDRVLIKGVGLTFIDTVLALTEGRGGVFERGINDDLVYRASGNEPCCLYPFSRSGLPMLPRHEPQKTVLPKLNYFNEKVITQLKQQKAKIDFKTQILPLIEQDVLLAYYSKLFALYNETLDVSKDFKTIQQQIQVFHVMHPDEPAFSLRTLLASNSETENYSFLTTLNTFIEAAEQGCEQHPLAAASAVWRVASKGFNELYSFGQLAPESQAFFDQHYAGHFNRMTYGPPLLNMYKVSALATAGFIDFSFVQSPQLLLDEESGGFLLQKRNQAVFAQHLIDARIPKVNIAIDPSALYQRMQQRGLIQLYSNDQDEQHFQPGCMYLTENGHPINTKGDIEDRLLVYGTPTEGITYDNDTLSRTRNDFVSSWAKRVVEHTNMYAGSVKPLQVKQSL